MPAVQHSRANTHRHTHIDRHTQTQTDRHTGIRCPAMMRLHSSITSVL